MRKLAIILFIGLFIPVSNFLSYVIPGGATHTFSRNVKPGWVTVQIKGNGSTNLDLYVYAGNVLIGRSESAGDSESVQIQTGGGGITIMVINRGRSDNNYQTNF